MKHLSIKNTRYDDKNRKEFFSHNLKNEVKYDDTGYVREENIKDFKKELDSFIEANGGRYEIFQNRVIYVRKYQKNS